MWIVLALGACAALLLGGCSSQGPTAPVPLVWREEANPDPEYRSLHDVWGTRDSTFAVGSAGLVLLRTGSRWTLQESGTMRHLYSVWGSSHTNVFAAGARGTILHFDGVSWQPENVDSLAGTADIAALWGASEQDVYAVGAGGLVLHRAKGRWQRLPVPATYSDLFESIWGTSPADLFVVGDSGRILHYDGSIWTLSLATPRMLSDVWGASARDVFVVGGTLEGAGGVLHFDGSTWTEMPLDEVRSLASVWGTGAADVYAVGATGSVYAYHGSSWSVQHLRHGIVLLGVWGRPGDLYAVGSSGLILHGTSR